MVETALTSREPEGVQTPADDSRALVPVTGAATRPLCATPRPAAFLAHLIAVKEKHPQTCERRRAEPAEAVNAYRAAMSAASGRP